MGKFTISLFTLISLSTFGHSKSIIYNKAISALDEIGEEWVLKGKDDCEPQVVTSPKGGKSFLGKIPQGEQKLALKGLPVHKFVRVEFDLITVGSWDGSHANWGPDIWSFRIDKRSPLVESSFCNNAGDLNQSFPDFRSTKRKPNKNWTGASKTKTLGYIWSIGGRQITADAVYHFDFIVPHSGSTMDLKFKSEFRDLDIPDPDVDQWYGLDNVKVTCLENHAELSLEEAVKAVGSLSSDDAVVRYSARMKLISSPTNTVKVILEKMKERSDVVLDGLAQKLGAESYKVREAATKELALVDSKHAGQLRKFRVNATDPEIRERIDYVLGLIQTEVATAVWHDYAHVLAIIDTKGANQLLSDYDLRALLK